MTWSPPLIRKFAAMRWRTVRIFSACITGAVMFSALAGCMSASRLHDSLAHAWNARARGLPAVPAFDENSAPARVANAAPIAPLVTAPPVFEWRKVGRSTGGRSFHVTSAGQDGFRTLVVGSVGGNDPLAIELVEQLARHLHDDHAILGGFETTIIQTLNPDGAANRSLLNETGVYVNHHFPRRNSRKNEGDHEIAEVAFLLQQLTELQPRRVVHIRTVRGKAGLIATSSSAQSAASEIADWLGFRQILLPAEAVEGSVERYLAELGTSQIITLGIPDSSKSGELWARYGDSLLNLLLDENLATREMARRNKEQTSADRRNRDTKSSDQPAAPRSP